jgi:D-serine deaminase-like pyridoxal phosphate-dependent protein
MENDTVIAVGESVKHLSEITQEDAERIDEALNLFIRNHESVHRKEITLAELDALHEEIDASGLPADDVMSYIRASKSLRDKAQAEQRAREEETRAAEREAQRKAERDEYCAPESCRSRPRIAAEKSTCAASGPQHSSLHVNIRKPRKKLCRPRTW